LDIATYNRDSWDREVERKNVWTVPVEPQVIAAARRGVWEIVLTPHKPVPTSWFPELQGVDVLCLASGGGQQGPILAAAGATVTVFDASAKQLSQDQLVANRDGLEITTIQGDMRDLAMLGDESFDLIVHPVSNCFVEDVRPVWREAYRVLRPAGALLAGFTNPVEYIFDGELAEKGELKVRHELPYSDVTSLTEQERRQYTDKQEPLVFGHLLEDQIGGQIAAGFVISGFYEDFARDSAISKYMPTFIATRAQKP